MSCFVSFKKNIYVKRFWPLGDWKWMDCIFGSQLRTMSWFVSYLWKYICKAVLAPRGLKMCGFFLLVDTPFYVCTTKKNHFGKHVSGEILDEIDSSSIYPDFLYVPLIISVTVYLVIGWYISRMNPWCWNTISASSNPTGFSSSVFHPGAIVNLC